MELLHQETDEDHPLKASEICEKLLSFGITCDRRTLTRDIALLNEYGFEVLSVMISHDKGYYIVDRSFSVPELKILIDAVQAASFITDKKTNELISKISALGGSHRADILKSNTVSFNTRKHRNESIYYNVYTLETAIESRKKVLFRYFDLDHNANKVYRKERELYSVEPVGLVFNEDNYYLMAYSEKYDNTTNYRVDRMDGVRIGEESVSEKALSLRESISGYTQEAFKMYSGRSELVTLRFDKKLIGAVFDRFGEDTAMIPMGENECAASVTVQLSPTFWGWMFQFGRLMRIISPDSAIEEYRNKAEELLK